LKRPDPRKAAWEILCRVDEGAFADLALDAALKRMAGSDPRDRGLLTELVYGALRQRGRLDFALARCCSKPLLKTEPKVLNLLRIGAYQILLLDRIPASAAVHSTVELARGIGLERVTGFVNGVLRALTREKEAIAESIAGMPPRQRLVHDLSIPGWLAKRWLREYGLDEAMRIAESFLEPAPFTLRVNTLKISRQEYLARLREAGHEGEPTRFAPEGVTLLRRGADALPGADEGLFQVQDEASMLVAHLLAPRTGETILDACAAPGGKTTHIAALTDGKASVLALDLHPSRIQLVNEGAKRLGCSGIEVRAWDMTRPPGFVGERSFDRILVDAPCSGMGVLRRNPEIRWRRGVEDVRVMAQTQLAILKNAASLLRPGGHLLYSLCTLTPEETEGVVCDFLATCPDFVREDLRQSAPAEWASLFDDHGALRTFPHRHGRMDAFFAVRFRREDV